MTQLQQAIALLQVARGLIEEAAQWQDDVGYREDLQDAAEDVGPILCCLESFGTPREPAPDACYADCITPDVPQGHDTVLGYLARHHADVLDLIDPLNPNDTVRDGWWLYQQSK